jgi:hypothetical protein
VRWRRVSVIFLLTGFLLNPDLQANDEPEPSAPTGDRSDDLIEEAARLEEILVKRAEEARERTVTRAESVLEERDATARRNTQDVLSRLKREEIKFRQRIARLERIRDVMRDKRNPQLAERLQAIIVIEQARHDMKIDKLKEEDLKATELYEELLEELDEPAATPPAMPAESQADEENGTS